MWPTFTTRVPGKWILAGEHSVLRGVTAVALPHPEAGLTLSFRPGSAGFTVLPPDAGSVVTDLLAAVRDSWEAEDRSFRGPAGTLEIVSTIPVGAGLGSSAALCVALTRWMAEPLAIPEREHFEFATRLEHRFHGKSSGMDVAAVSANQPISFIMGRGATTLGVKRLPKFTFHDTGLRSRTSECVIRVEQFRESSPMIAMKIDEAMGAAARGAMEGLFRYDKGEHREGLQLLAQSMKQSQECFYSWELVPGAAKRLEEKLLQEGALAAKLTGAGGGGFVVALWP